MDIQLSTLNSQLSTPVVTLTPAAIQRVKYLIEKKGERGLGFRIAVKGGGCSGLSYILSLENTSRPDDISWEVDGIPIQVDPKSARFIAGTTIDFSVKNLLEGGWVFTNPNAQRSCGCGTSFTPKT